MSKAAGPRCNRTLLRQVLYQIETHRDEWSQYRWVCEGPSVTTYCLAGWAYVLGTGERFFDVAGLVVGHSRPVEQTARELLGLTEEQAKQLFFYALKPTPPPSKEAGWLPITFEDLCERVFRVTGVRYRSGRLLRSG